MDDSAAVQWERNEGWLRADGFTRAEWLERSNLVRGQILGAKCYGVSCRCWDPETKTCGAPDTGGPELCSELDKLCGA